MDRRAWLSHDVCWLRPHRSEPGLHRFPALKAIGTVDATVEHMGQTRVSQRYFLSSAPLSATAILHANMALIRHTALNIFKNTNGKVILKNRIKLAAWDDEYLF
ncbi:hypothetical protein ABIE58_003864 [Roseovarius sp. MBR-78]|jgi:hypothetical protein|uniref:hypothetical protein n=1 Tax=Roseovarius sp. MBR-78 TaxID=3156460 RepID=UPI0033936AAC